MKEATGELSGGLVTMICVAIFIAFFYYTIWPLIDDNFERETSCEKALCDTNPDADGMVECYMKGNESNKFMCKYKG